MPPAMMMVVSFFRASIMSVDQFFDFGLEFGEVGGFHHVGVGGPTHEAFLILGVGGVQDDRQALFQPQDAGQGLQAVHAGHADVQDDQVQGLLLHHLQGLPGVGGGQDLIAFVEQLFLQQGADGIVVIHHQDRFHRQLLQDITDLLMSWIYMPSGSRGQASEMKKSPL